MKEIYELLSTEVFKTLINCNSIKITQLKAIINILIKMNIAFDFSFIPGSSRVASQAQLTIFINPSTTLRFVITFEPGEIL